METLLGRVLTSDEIPREAHQRLALAHPCAAHASMPVVPPITLTLSVRILFVTSRLTDDISAVVRDVRLFPSSRLLKPCGFLGFGYGLTGAFLRLN